jgi:TatA/E family protein of Tat protein translocase
MPFINGIGAPELIIILIIALIVVGPGRLPDVGSALGKSIREFRKAATDVKDATSLEEKPQSGPGPDAAAASVVTAVPATAAATTAAAPAAARTAAAPAAATTPAAPDAPDAPDVSELPEPVHAEDEQPTPTA